MDDNQPDLPPEDVSGHGFDPGDEEIGTVPGRQVTNWDLWRMLSRLERYFAKLDERLGNVVSNHNDLRQVVAGVVNRVITLEADVRPLKQAAAHDDVQAREMRAFGYGLISLMVAAIISAVVLHLIGLH